MKTKQINVIPLLIMLLYCGQIFSSPPSITPKSPTAASLVKSIEYPVTLNTGVPTIAIPLKTIKYGQIELPITLSYHSGGFKQGEQSSIYGLGWSSSLDFQITREINGLDDFDEFGIYFNDYFQNRNDPQKFSLMLVKARLKEYDTQPDKFYYRINGKSGAFYFVNGINGNKEIVLSPYNGVKINIIQIQFYEGFNLRIRLGFKITDTDGSVYLFDDKRESTEMSINSHKTAIVNTAWKCSSLTSANKQNEIRFFYNKEIQTQSFSSNESVEVVEAANIVKHASSFDPVEEYNLQNLPYDHMIQDQGGIGYEKSILSKFTIPHIIYNAINPSSRGVYLKGDTTFHYMTTIPYSGHRFKTELLLTSIEYGGCVNNMNYDANNQLSSIEMKGVANNLPDSARYIISFKQSKLGIMPHATFYLDTIVVSGCDFKNNEKYAFLYNDKYGFNTDCTLSDGWGGLNGNLDMNGISVPKLVISEDSSLVEFPKSITLGNANYSYLPDNNAMRGIIQRITYPTKGFTMFEFENNTVSAKGDAIIEVGGIRIKSIYNYNKDFTFLSGKYYDYQLNEIVNSSGTTNYYDCNSSRSLNPNLFALSQIEHRIIPVEGTNWTVSFNNPSLFTLDPNNEYLKYYSYQKKTIYYPRIVFNMSFSGNPVDYKKVTEYQMEKNPMIGNLKPSFKTEYTFHDRPKELQNGVYNDFVNTTFVLKERDYYIGKCKTICKYKIVDGQSQIVHKTENVYANICRGGQYEGYNFYDPNVFNEEPFREQFNGDYNKWMSFFAIIDQTPGFISGDVVYPLGDFVLKSTTEKQYENNDSITTTTHFGYNENAQLAQVSTKISDTKMKVSTTIYPYRPSGDRVSASYITAMYNNNNLTSPIAKLDFIVDNEGFDSLNINDYDEGHNLLKPSLLSGDWFYSYEFPYSTYAEKKQPLLSGQLFIYDNDGLFKKCYAAIPELGKGYTPPVYSDLTGSTIPKGYKESFSINYNSVKNPIEITEYNKPTVVYLWGYDNQYPIAEIKNSSYNEVLTKLSASGITDIYSFSKTSEADIEKLKKIINIMPNAQVSIFSYYPWGGIKEMFNPRSLGSKYEFDSLYRLTKMYNNGKKQSEFQYNYSK